MVYRTASRVSNRNRKTRADARHVPIFVEGVFRELNAYSSCGESKLECVVAKRCQEIIPLSATRRFAFETLSVLSDVSKAKFVPQHEPICDILAASCHDGRITPDGEHTTHVSTVVGLYPLHKNCFSW